MRTDEEKAVHAAYMRAYARDPVSGPRMRERNRIQRSTGAGFIKRMLTQARARARNFGLPFTLVFEDIQIPTHCPILGVELKHGTQLDHENSPSLDRINPQLGYVKGNVAVISHQANRMKNHGTADDHIRIANWIRRSTPADTTPGYLSYKY